jgi:hypothetical protein
MNDKPAPSPLTDTECNSDLLTEKAAVGTNGTGMLGFSKKHSFIVRSLMKAPPQLGENLFSIRIVHAADLSALKTGSVKVTYLRLGSHNNMPPFQGAVLAQTDGSYSFDLTLKKYGEYKVTIDISEGASEDEHVFNFKF